jgi:hypothetical protein
MFLNDRQDLLLGIVQRTIDQITQGISRNSATFKILVFCFCSVSLWCLSRIGCEFIDSEFCIFPRFTEEMHVVDVPSEVMSMAPEAAIYGVHRALSK